MSTALVDLYHGDVTETLRQMPERSVHCVVTSPPYWALRDYHTPGQIGLEPTMEEYVAKLVAVFAVVRRVLRDDGLCFVNLGDSYAGSWGSMSHDLDGKAKRQGTNERPATSRPKATGLKPLDLCNIPHRVAQAMQSDGWYWRGTWHWIKRSPMPESVSGTRWERHWVKVGASDRAANAFQDGAYQEHKQGVGTASRAEREDYFASGNGGAQRQPCPGCAACTYPDQPQRNGWVLRRGSWRWTDAVEYVFLFAKQPGYTAFQEQVREEVSQESLARYERGSTYDGSKPYVMANPPSGNLAGRNPRNYGILSSEPSSEPHYATYPQALIEPFIRAATSDKGVCAACGAQWVPVVEHSQKYQAMLDNTSERWFQRKENPFTNGKKSDNTFHGTLPEINVLAYWPCCTCPPHAPVPATVLDPFVGSGTTCIAARRLGRRSIGIDLSAAYLDIAVRRLADEKNSQAAMIV